MNENSYPKDMIRSPDGEEMIGTSNRDTLGALDLIDPQRLWLRTKEMRYWLIGIIAAAISLAVLYTLLQTPQYMATSQIEISRVDSGGAEIEEIAIQGEQRDRQYYETQYLLLQSRAHAERVAEAENIQQDREALTALGFPEGASPSPRAIAGTLLGHTTVKPLENSNLVDISVTSSSAAVSARIANAWAQQFLDANYQKRFGDTVDARRQLENQLAELRERLETSEAELIKYANANGIVMLQKSTSGDDGGAQQTLVESQLAALNSALAEATARRIAVESASRSGATSNEGQASIRGRIAEVEATLARLRTTLGPQNSQVEAAEAELQSLTSSLSRARGLSGSELGAQLRSAQREEAELQARFDAARNSYLAQQDQGVEYGILEREVSTNRELYNALLQRYKELGVAATGRNNMTLVARAEAPGGPYSPSLTWNILIALFGSIVVCALLVLARDLMDNTVRDYAEIRRRLGVPVLGLIPQFDDDDIDNQLRDPHSTLSEAYASARVAVDFATDKDEKVLLITSTRPGEGKSLSSLALAYNLARQGNKVLLIDMDLRRHGLSIRMDRSNKNVGMATYLAGQVDSLPIEHHDEFGLDFVCCGKSTLNAADILATSRTEMVIAEVRQRYDYVVLDAPPVLGLADTPQLARSADALVYIVQANASTFHSISQAMGRLRAAHSNILGVIVTKLDKRNESYSYGYGYGYGYSYEASQDTSGKG